MIVPNEKFMRVAILEAIKASKKGDYPIGAVITKGSTIIARMPNKAMVNSDPTQHAEIEVIRLALHKMKSAYLQKCILYSTHEPCPMCSTAAMWTKLKGIIYGSRMSDIVDFRSSNKTDKMAWRTVLIPAPDILSKGEPRLEYVKDFMRDECIKLFYS